MKILYVTKNDNKLAHAQQFTAGSGIEIKSSKIEVPEIQAASVHEVIKHKALSAWNLLQKPLIVSDSGWEIPALGGFPGPYMHHINSWFTPEDFLALMQKKQDKKIVLNHLIAVVLNGEPKIFTEKTYGKFISQPRGRGTSLDRVVVMGKSHGTIAENNNAGIVSADGQAIWSEIVEYILTGK
ncbi:MAG: dITP/XTP pyrophosphatase [bacterium ADurb.Bin212]|nr:MAG: dITP/XTP pyrophosphatase [bacterium ADurb.Bin212]